MYNEKQKCNASANRLTVTVLCYTEKYIKQKNRTAKKKNPEKTPRKINYVELRFSELHIFLTFKL